MSLSQDLKGKFALITGGTTGIGYATAQEFIARGARVVITGRSNDTVQAAAATLGSGTRGIASDQGNLAQVRALTAQLSADGTPLDILFVNAGIGSFEPLEGVTEEGYDAILDTNLKGPLFLLQGLQPLLRDGASVIFLSSVVANLPSPLMFPYSASKAGLNALMLSAASALAPRKIRVNSVNPGPIDTPIFGKTGIPEDQVAGMKHQMAERVPLKRLGTAEEVGALVAFLASDAAGFITGAQFDINGGYALPQ